MKITVNTKFNIKSLVQRLNSMTTENYVAELKSFEEKTITYFCQSNNIYRMDLYAKNFIYTLDRQEKAYLKQHLNEQGKENYRYLKKYLKNIK